MATPEMQALEARARAAGRRAHRRDPARPAAVRPDRRRARRRGTTPGSTPSRSGVVERYHRDFVRAGAALADAGPRHGCGRSTRSSPRSPPSSAPACSPRPTTSRCTSPTGPSSTGSPPTRSRPPRAPRQTAGPRRATCSPCRCPPSSRRISSLTNRDVRRRLHEAVDQPGHPRRRARHPRPGRPRSAALRAERARAARLRRPRRATSPPTRPPAPPRRSLDDARRAGRAGDGQRSRPSAAASQALLRRRRRRGPAAAVGLGVLRRAGAGRDATTSTPTRCGRTSSSTGCCTTASSSPPRGSTASPSTAARRPAGYHPDVRVFEVRDARRHAARPVPRATSSPGDTKRGGAWMNDVRRPVAPARHPARSWSTTSTCRKPPAGRAGAADPRRGPHRCSTSSATPCTACSPTSAYPRLSGHRVPRDFVEFPSPGQRDVGAGGPRSSRNYAGTTRPASRCRRTSSTRLRRRRGVRPGLRARAIPRRRAARPGVAPADRGAGRRRPSDVEAFEAAALTPARRRAPAWCRRATAATYFAHIFAGGYDAGLLLLHLERGARRRHRSSGSRENGGLRRANGDLFRARAARPSAAPSTRWTRSPPCAGRDPSIEPLLRRRGLTPAYTSEDAGGAPVDGDGGAGQV